MPLLAVLVKLVAAAAACRRVGAAAEHGAFSDDVKVISAGGACATDMATMFEGPLRGNLAKWRARERRTAADLRAFARAVEQPPGPPDHGAEQLGVRAVAA